MATKPIFIYPHRRVDSGRIAKSFAMSLGEQSERGFYQVLRAAPQDDLKPNKSKECCTTKRKLP
jgi:hypothetical protein